MARKFLYVVAFLIVLALGATFAYRIWGPQLLRWTSVPSIAFRAEGALPTRFYDDPQHWLAHPRLADDPARWLPRGVARAAPGNAAVFFIHPTSYLDKRQWNAPLDDADANGRAQLFLRGQASAFNAVGQVWAPRYRQATFGAFLTTGADRDKALDLAFRDVEQAFDRFLAEAGDRPIILAGHSQGALHLTRLLRDRIADQPVARRVVAAYVVGWPVSRTADLPLLGLPECTRADQAGCILSWQSFAEPADFSLITDVYDATTGFNGSSRRGTPMICTNPITGTPNASAPTTANTGTLIPNGDFTDATLETGRVPARCGEGGFLLIGNNPPSLGGYVLPGNNYHVYDYSLFWADVRADAARRLAAFGARG
ncbi:DUF3089 domain-containing protein [Sphingomonas aracearum]|uniref:DUF3089 domain-containing protein n=1 Tax=Sphingomonas aracearum TaxID=2283317 RepID=A0A369VWI5_9SPHN|nr:DUF3089 domain-containing protein [Sphingomonas aracearum]RDE06199.1 DUF3089 domain-containing protein [Sphingomonas aracearum]